MSFLTQPDAFLYAKENIPHPLLRPCTNHWYMSPDCLIVQKHHQDHKISLIGTIFDWRSPGDRPSDIARHLAGCSSTDELTRELLHLGGVYLVLSESPRGTFLFPDSGALRPCFYYHHQGFTYLASCAQLLAESLPESIRPKREKTDFYQTVFKKKRLFLGGRTHFRGVRMLLPNHYLDLQSGRQRRYFPFSPIQRYQPKEALDRIIPILRGQWAAAAERYDLVLPLTAGWDSRVLLATGKAQLSHIDTTYTMRHPFMGERHEDVRIPPQLAQTADLPHQFFSNDGEADPAIQARLQKLVDFPNPRNAAIHTNVYNPELAGKLIVSGIASETAKRYYGEESNTTPERLAILAGYGEHPYAVETMDEWLQGAAPVTENGYDLIDFFHWEYNVGSSVARETTEINLSAAGVFPPFNHKQLISTLLGVDPRYRDMYDHRIYRLLINRLWPELMRFPVNPNPKSNIIRLMKRMGIYTAYSDLKRRILKKG